MAQITDSMLLSIIQYAEQGKIFPLTANELRQLAYMAHAAAPPSPPMVSDKMREALKRIAAHGYGLEQNATDEERADYWADVAIAQRRIARDALALLPQSPQEGMVLVPREPTEAMVWAGTKARAGTGSLSGAENTEATWRAMVAASSHSQEQENGDE